MICHVSWCVREEGHAGEHSVIRRRRPASEYTAPSVGFLSDELSGALSDSPVLVAVGEYLMPLRRVVAVELGNDLTGYVVEAGVDEPTDEAAVRNALGMDR